MKIPLKYLLCFLVILVLAGIARFIRIDHRPMHHDEAVNAHKLGALLEGGGFRYDRTEFHGPILYYSSCVLAGITGKKDLCSLDVKTIRATTAVYGMGIILLLLLLAGVLGWELLLISALVFAFAPALLYFSRYFIHEMLLLFFSFMALISVYRYFLTGHPAWICLLGASVGLMHATKETFILNLAALAAAMLVIWFINGKGKLHASRGSLRFRKWHLLPMVVIAIIVSATLFSDFFQYPRGIVDSIAAYGVYFRRASVDDAHLHPWFYYIDLLFSSSNQAGIILSEIWLLLLSVAGMILAIVKRKKGVEVSFILFTGIYSFLLMAIYSLIPYKTPWNIIQFYPGLVLLAGYAIREIIRVRRSGWWKPVILAVALAGGIHWLYVSYRINYPDSSSPGNPYVYAHTSRDVFRLNQLISELAGVHPEGHDMHMDIIMTGHEYWPLPWYLRHYTHCGWWDQVPGERPVAPLVIAEAGLEDELIHKLYQEPPPGKRTLYIRANRGYMELRHGQEIRVYMRKDLWDLLKGSVDSP